MSRLRRTIGCGGILAGIIGTICSLQEADSSKYSQIRYRQERLIGRRAGLNAELESQYHNYNGSLSITAPYKGRENNTITIESSRAQSERLHKIRTMIQQIETLEQGAREDILSTLKSDIYLGSALLTNLLLCGVSLAAVTRSKGRS